MWKRYNETGNVETLPRTGRRKVLTELQRADIVRIFQNNPFRTVASVAAEYNVGVHPISRLLKQNELKCRVAAKQTKLNDDHKIYRLAFCQEMLDDWQEDRLKTIVFSDEKVFSTDVRWRKLVYRTGYPILATSRRI